MQYFQGENLAQRYYKVAIFTYPEIGIFYIKLACNGRFPGLEVRFKRQNANLFRVGILIQFSEKKISVKFEN